jgi:hypothetical protein
MKYEKARDWCHVRSAIYRKGNPGAKYWKNSTATLDSQVSESEKNFVDWEEYDPRDHEECSAFNEMPA